ncbi:piggyBac transposable element-derived protein 2-like [Amyelois transitella]|uniref:piggyBac transposable element-derived protein 2-like n=1 Tax=Amyelois transitella TaxID=680683 RepID=UPI00298FA616|nr:piggyBac transposable element-derived protein 2-like [Amyelois transitella]
MGVVKMPAYTDFWAKESRYSKVADVMPLKKFQKIRKFLHFANNNEDDGDRYYKIRPLLERIRKNCLSIEQEGKYSIDEMMVPYKGTRAGNRRQYMKGKPKKWGYKVFVRAGVSGLVYDFIIYGGEDTFRFNEFTSAESTMGFGAKVVIALTKSIQNPACSVLYFDNFFCSLELVTYLRDNYGVFSLGTLRSNRLRGAQKLLKSDKYMKKNGRGSFCQIVSTKRKVVIVKWFDNKAIHLASSFVDAHPLDEVLRYNKHIRARSKVKCPQIVKQYNVHMGGVDLADMLVALYRTEFKGHRWYLVIFSQMLDICVNNAWLLYRRDHKLSNQKPALKLKCFRLNVAAALAAAGRDEIKPEDFKSPKIVTPSGPLPIDSIRYDCIGHWPAVDKKGRCRFCKLGQTTILCKKCKVRLCLMDKRNCFESFHKGS